MFDYLFIKGCYSLDNFYDVTNWTEASITVGLVVKSVATTLPTTMSVVGSILTLCDLRIMCICVCLCLTFKSFLSEEVCNVEVVK